MLPNSVLFGLGDGLPLGLTFGLVAGTGTGLPLGLEFRSAGPNGASVRPFPYRTFAFGFFRGLALALAAWLTFGLRFGAAFGLMSGLGLLLVCMLRFAPSDEYQALAKPTLHRANCWGHSSAVAQSGSQGFSRGY